MATQNLGKVVGDSAYEVAVSQGYVGTESEWLASLVGPAGEDGPAGADGAAAGFGTPTISVSTLSAGLAATASVSATGTDTAKVFHFDFGIPQGEPGSGASLVAGTGIDITGDTISNTMPYDDAATASYIFNNFGMSVSTTTTLESATASIDGGAATVSLFWNRWSKPELSVYIDDTLTDTIEAEDWVFDSQTDYNTASLSGGGSISWVQIDQHFLLSGLSGSEVKLEYVGTAIVRTPLDDLYIDNTIARASDIPTLSAGTGITITTSGSANSISVNEPVPTVSTASAGDVLTVSDGAAVWAAPVAPTFTESDPVFSASPAATITASDITNWNGIVGVPTASASDEGKALVVSDSTGSIGWGEVGGGSSNPRVVRLYTSLSDMSAADKALVSEIYQKYYQLHNLSEPMPLFYGPTYNYYYNLVGKNADRNEMYLEAVVPIISSSYDQTHIHRITLGFYNNNLSSVEMGYLTDSSQVVMVNNLPTPDGTTITASGNVWSAVGGGGSVTAPIVFETDHETGEDYISACYSDDMASLMSNAYDQESEQYNTEHTATITPDAISVISELDGTGININDSAIDFNGPNGNAATLTRYEVQLADETLDPRFEIDSPMTIVKNLALEAPNGNLYMINVDNSGNLSATLWEDPTEPVEPDPEEEPGE